MISKKENVRAFSKTQREPSAFQKMLFTEANKIIVGHLHSLILVFDVVEAFFDKFV